MNISKIKEIFHYIVGCFILIFGFYLTFFEGEKWHFILYSLVLYSVIYLILWKMRKTRLGWFESLFIYAGLHLFLLGVVSGSNYLQVKEFELTHKDWVKVQDINLEKIEVGYKGERRRIHHTYIDVTLQYHFNNQVWNHSYEHLHKMYYLWLFESSTNLENLIIERVNHSLDKHLYQLYVNPDNPNESIFYLDQEYYNLRNSGFIWIIYYAQVLIFVILIIIVFVIFDAIKNNDSVIQKKSKKKNLSERKDINLKR